ncbi:unnamed protein product [Diatraea saccharalis]|uniref:Uncharacterized protein n=1 Tax=Diatraea saccharalis TaxID=40085 RepID=A0A9N9RE97_9NEOP|nr:unnamed protein product [Diatraea saccharalis]
MSSDFYFRKWKQTLIHLEDLVQLDLEYQSSKEHDKTICAAVMRLTGILGRYNQLHNEALECLQQNLQVQKVHYIADVVKAITKRILELKHNIRKLECSNIQFMGHGLANHKLTPMDAELSEFPPHVKRPEHIELLIEEAFKKSEERKQELRRLALESEQLKNNESRPVTNWWDDEQQEENESYQESITEKESEETLQRKQMAAIIQAHERSRAYFEIKRKRKLQFKEYELLGMQLNRKLNKDPSNNNDEVRSEKLSFDRMQRRKIIELEWRDSCEKLKQEFMKRKLDDVAENYRDFVRCWFRKCEIVSVLIMKEELPDPVEWWEQYEQYLADKKSNKNQTAMQKKYEEMQAKEEAMMKKREELIKKKLQTELMRKLMKNPTLHPGYIYPQSKKTNHILEVIKCYNDDWSQLDLLNSLDVKERFVHDVDINNVYAEIRKEIMNAVNDDMREELKLLKKALKNDYENMDEKLPEPMRKDKYIFFSNHSVPADLNVAGLAFVLRGYSYGYLKKALTDFLSPERVVKIAAYGLFPQEIYDYIINDAENKIEYEKYQKWYYDQAHWGKKEKKHIMEQREYKEALIMYQERIKKKNNQQHK